MVTLNNLGINKQELIVPGKRFLFSNQQLVAAFTDELYADLSRKLPNSLRHIREWAQSLAIPSEKIRPISSTALEKMFLS